MKWRCDLDVARILIGYTQIEDAAVQPGDVVFDTKPDLPLGEYRWDGEKFVPARNARALSDDGPDFFVAMYRLCRRLEKANVINMPAPTKSWMEYFRKGFTNDPHVEP